MVWNWSEFQWPPCVCITPLWHLGMLLMRRQMVFRKISSQTRTQISANSWTACFTTWWMGRNVMSQICSIRFRPGERAGQSIRSTIVETADTLQLYEIQLRLALGGTFGGLEDVINSRTFSTASTDSCAQCEPAFICGEHKAPVAILGCKYNPPLWLSGPHSILMETVTNAHLGLAGGHLALALLPLVKSLKTLSCCWVVGFFHVSWCTSLSPSSASMLWTLPWQTGKI